jgi:hypothetical protein
LGSSLHLRVFGGPRKGRNAQESRPASTWPLADRPDRQQPLACQAASAKPELLQAIHDIKESIEDAEVLS